MQPGDRLPTEAELATEFGLSRTSVREAMRFLVARGVVDIRAGSGAVVAAIDAESASESLALFLERRPASDYHAIHEVREVLEMRAARCAASRASTGDVKRLAEVHAAMLPLADGSDWDALSRADIDFHAKIAAASGNEILWTLLDALVHPESGNAEPSADGLSADARRVADALDRRGRLLPEVAARAGLSFGDAASALLELESAGLAKEGGAGWARVRPGR